MGGELTFEGWPRKVALSPAYRYALAVTSLSLPFAWASVHYYEAASIAALVCALVLALPLYLPTRVTVSAAGVAYVRLGKQVHIPRGAIRGVSARPGVLELDLGAGASLHVYLPPRADWSVGREPPEQALSRGVRRIFWLAPA